jgi:integrase
MSYQLLAMSLEKKKNKRMTKKRSSSEGTIYQLPSGNWRAQICIDRKRLSTTRRTKMEAREWIRETLAQIGQGMTYEAAQTRLDDFLNSWLETKRYSIRAATYEQYGIMIRVYIIPKIGSYKLIDLTPALIQSFIDGQLRDDTGARTVQVTHGILQNALNHAQLIGLIGRNPAERVKVPRPARRELSVWTEEEVSQFLGSIQGERNEYLYHIALTTGMRQGELLGLKWEDIDWRRGTILVKRQAVEIKGGGFGFAEPKSQRSCRSVDLGVGSVEKLHNQYENVNLMRQIARDKWQENDLVFPSMRGTPQLGTNLDRDFKQLVERSGLPKIRFHDLRHTAASIMLSRGIPAVIVSGMLGHTMNILLTTYAHYIPSTQAEAARIMDELTTPVKFSPREK